MKLSEAMREGIKQSGQAYHNYIVHNQDDELYTCAVGAVALGAYGEYTFIRDLNDRLYLDVPVLQRGVEPALPHMFSAEVESQLVYLNDVKHWTREQIVGWLEDLGL
jgi:hypothetical protein